MKKRILAALLSAAMAVTLLAGCSTPKSDDGGSEGEGGSGEKVFRYATRTEPTSLDPQKGNCIPDNELQHAVTESLVRNTGGEITPGVAESWEVSDDGLVYTFHLREDAKWSDGEPITADDFVYGWQRLLDPETGALYAFIGEYIKNGYAVETGEVDPSELGVKAIDEKTFEVTLEKPTAYFLSLVGSSGQYAPCRKDIVEKYGNDFAATADKNVYSGPFKLISSENQEYVFEKNENYWDADNIKLDKAIMSYVEKAETQLAMYESGELDYVEIPSASVPEYEGQDNTFLNGNVDFFYINHKSENKVLGNKNFRLALNYALDRNSYIKLATSDVYKPSNSLVFEGLQGAEKTYGEEYELNSYPLDGDTDKAVEYLNDAMSELGIANASDISVEIVTTDVESSKKIAEVCQELWQKALGINVTIRQVTYADIYGTVLPGGDFEIGYGGWGADYDDPYSYLELFKSDSFYNYSQYANDEVDADLKASQTETDAKTRMDYLFDAEQKIIDDGAFIPLQQREIHYLVSEKVSGLVFFHCAINLDWVYADVAE